MADGVTPARAEIIMLNEAQRSSNGGAVQPHQTMGARQLIKVRVRQNWVKNGGPLSDNEPKDVLRRLKPPTPRDASRGSRRASSSAGGATSRRSGGKRCGGCTGRGS